MSGPVAFHLPARSMAAAVAWRDLGDTGLRAPVLEAPVVDSVWRELEAAAALWRTKPLAARVERLAVALAQVRRQGAGAWRETLAASTGLSAAGMDAAWDITFAPHTAAALRAALGQEELDEARLAALERDARLPRRLVHILAGNVLPPTLAFLLRGWLLGAAQWLRPAEREPLFAVCLLEALRPMLPDLVASTAVLWWPHDGGDMETAVMTAANVVTVQGSDAALQAVQAKLAALSPPPPCLGYGARWSGALVTAAAQTPATAAALARDVALFDQQGCLSPTLVFAAAGGALEGWCGELAMALRAEEERMPRGGLPPPAAAALRHWHEQSRLELALGDLRGLWEDGTAWAVILLARCELHATPLDRHVVVVPFDTIEGLAAALGDERAKLQGLALAADGWSDAERTRALELLEPTRVAPVGTLQAAPLGWAQDHKLPFATLFLPGIREVRNG